MCRDIGAKKKFNNGVQILKNGSVVQTVGSRYKNRLPGNHAPKQFVKREVQKRR